MIESTCPHKWDWQKYGICTMCQQDMQNRHSANYITGEMLSRIQSISHTNDLPSRYVRMMASELLSLRQQIGRRQSELEFIMQKNMQAPEQEPVQAVPVAVIEQIRALKPTHRMVNLYDAVRRDTVDEVLAILNVTHPAPLDSDTRKMVLELCAQVIRNSGEYTHIPGTVEAMAADIIERLEAGE